MKKNIIASLLWSLLIAHSVQLFSTTTTHHMMIFIECGMNENLNALLNAPDTTECTTSNEFLSALYQEAGPLLIPAPLFENILRFKALFEDLTHIGIDQLQKHYQHTKLFDNPGCTEQIQELATSLVKAYKPAATWLKQQELTWPVWIRHIIDTNGPQSSAPADKTWQKIRSLMATIKKDHGIDPEYLMILLTQAAFMPLHRYKIYTVSYGGQKSTAYLFLPTTVLAAENINQIVIEHDGLTTRECHLGLKIDHLEEIRPQELNNLILDHPNHSCPGDITQLLRKIFVPRTHRCAESIYWAIYLIGHGFYFHEKPEKMRVSGFTLNQFKNILRFLNTDINTRILIYSSCFGGGQLFVDAFNDQTSNKPLNLDYTIVSDVATEVATGRYNTKFAPAHTAHIVPQTLSHINSFVFSQDFGSFFEKIKKTDLINRETFGLISPLLHLMDDAQAHPLLFVRYFPAIRLPGAPWFRLLDLPSRVVPITKKSIEGMIERSHEDHPPRVEIQDGQDILLVHEKRVPIEIHIANTNKENSFFPTVMSARPGKVVHQFMAIDASNHFLTSVAYSFFPFSDLSAPKLFIIDNLRAQLCLPLPGKKVGETVEFQTVLLANKVSIHKKDFNYLFFDSDGTTYGIGWDWGQPLPVERAAELVRPIEPSQKEALLNYFGMSLT